MSPVLSEDLSFTLKALTSSHKKERNESLVGIEPNNSLILHKYETLDSFIPDIIYNLKFIRLNPEKKIIVATRYEFEVSHQKKENFFEY